MTDNSILEVLTQLERDLEDIKSAKEQIDDVLEANDEINENLAEYSHQLASIATQLGSLKELIKSEMKGIISNIGANISERLASVGKLVSNIAKLSSEIEGNAKRIVVNTTETLNESCSKVIKSFEASTNSTCEHFSKRASGGVDKLVQTAMELKSSATYLSSSKIEILQKANGLASDLSELKGVVDRIEKAISSLESENTQQTNNQHKANGNINQVLANLKDYKTSLQYGVTSIEEKNNKAQNELREAINANRKISFGIVILVIIDIILRFI